jgi:hypothetical protein
VTEENFFRYEMMWEAHEKFAPFLEDAWKAEGKVGTMSQLKEKLTHLSGSLEGWGRDTFGNVQRDIRKLNDRLVTLQAKPLCQGPTDEE